MTTKKINWWKWIAIAIAATLTVCISGGVLASLGASVQPNASPSEPASVGASAPSKAAAASLSPAAASVAQFGSGTYVVGKEIPAGRYTVTMIDNQYCYWERLKADSGELDDVIANEVYMDKGKRSFTVKASDKYIQFKGDCVWSKG